MGVRERTSVGRSPSALTERRKVGEKGGKNQHAIGWSQGQRAVGAAVGSDKGGVKKLKKFTPSDARREKKGKRAAADAGIACAGKKEGIRVKNRTAFRRAPGAGFSVAQFSPCEKNPRYRVGAASH